MADSTNANGGGLSFDPTSSVPLTPPIEGTPTYNPTDLNVNYQSELQEMINTPLSDLVKEEPLTVGPTSVDYADTKGLEKYIYQDDFNGVGFNPSDPTNYERWVAKETWGSALAKGFDSFGDRFSNTFTDYWKDYGRMANSLAHFDTGKLLPEESELLELNFEEHLSSMNNYVFVEQDAQDDIFSKKSISEFVGNAGFALGTISALSLELLADAAITIATSGGGIGSFAATFGRLGSKIGFKTVGEFGKVGVKKGVKEALEEGTKRSGSILDDFMNKGTQLLDAPVETLAKKSAAEQAKLVNKTMNTPSIRARMMNELGQIISLNTSAIMKSKSFGDFVGNTIKGVPIVGSGVKYGEKIGHAAMAGESTASILGMGYRGIRRMGQEYNLAATEASFEAISSYGATLDKMIEQQEAITGESISANELENMKMYASKASFSNYGTNLAILLASNKLQFGGLFNKFTPSNRISSELIKDLAGGSDKILQVNRAFKSSDLLGKAYKKHSIWGTYGLAGKIAKDFGKKQAVYEIGKQFGKGFTRFEVTEGLQENLQEMSNSAWKNYYAGKVNGTMYTLEEAFGEGASEQFTKQGFKTFLQGALTGSVIRMPVKALTTTTDYAQKLTTQRQYEKGQDPITQQEAKVDSDIELINNFLQQASNKKFEATLFNFNNQMRSSQEQSKAAAEGKEYDFHNAKDNALLSAVVTAHRVGSSHLLAQALRDMGAGMTNEEFETAFGYSIEETKYNTPEEFANDVSKDIIKYTKTVDKITQNVKNNLEDPYVYEKDSDDYYTAHAVRAVQEEAISIIALNHLKAQRASERAQAVLNDYNSISDLASSSDYVHRVLGNPEMMNSELAILEFDLKSLNEGLSVEGVTAKEKKDIRAQIKAKEEEMELLGEWMSYWKVREEIVNRIDPTTGDVITGTTNKLDTFAGVKTKSVEMYDAYGQQMGPTQEDVWETNTTKVRDTFRKLVNVKNKQTGIPTTIQEGSLQNGFGKVIDFIQLEQDAKDYNNAVEALFDPISYRETTARMRNGQFKSDVLKMVDFIEYNLAKTINEILVNSGVISVQKDETDGTVKQYLYPWVTSLDSEKYKELVDNVTSALKESDGYKNLITVAMSDSIGIEQNKYAQEQMVEIDKFLKEQLKEHLQEYVPEGYQFDEVISNEDWATFEKDKTASAEIKDVIAQHLFDNGNDISTLTERQKEVYALHSADINERMRILKDGGKAEETKEVVEEQEKEEVKEIEEKEEAQEPKPIMNDIEAKAIELQSEIGRLQLLEITGQTELEDGTPIRTRIQELEHEIDALYENVDITEVGEQVEEVKDNTVVDDDVFDDAADPEDPNAYFKVNKNAQNEYDIVDRNGYIIKTYTSEEHANNVAKEFEAINDNFEFITSLTDKVDLKKGTIVGSMIVSIVEDSVSAMHKYNQSLKKKSGVNTLEEFYNSTKANRKTIDRLISNHVDMNSEVTVEEDFKTKESGVTPKKVDNYDPQSTKLTEVKAIIKTSIETLNNNLASFKLPSTQTGQTALLFTEDFGKFEVSKVEENFIGKIKKIKTSCK